MADMSPTFLEIDLELKQPKEYPLECAGSWILSLNLLQGKNTSSCVLTFPFFIRYREKLGSRAI